MRQYVKYVMCFFPLLFCVLSSAFPQDTAKLSLNLIFQRIDSVYPSVLLYENKIKALRALNEGSKAWMPPIFMVGADRFPYSLSGMKMEDPMNQAGLMFTLEQMIPNKTKLDAKYDYISSLENVQVNSSEWTKNILRGQARLYYYKRYSAEQKLTVIKKQRQVLELLISTAESKIPYGQSSLSTVFKARAKLAELKNMEAMLLSDIAECNIGLNTLMNRNVLTAFDIDTTIVFLAFPPAADTSFLGRHDILSMQSSIQSMQLNKKLMSAASKPDFGVRVSHMQMFGMPEQFSVMGMVTIPIVPWSSKMYKSDVKAMDFEILAMQQEVSAMKLMASQMVNEIISMLNYEKVQLKNFDDEIIPAYRKNFETSLLAYKQNTEDFFVLLDAWEMLLMKEMERADKLFDVLKLEAEYLYQTENLQ